MLTATLTRPTTITSAGITLIHRTPVLHFCRALIDADHADQPMTVEDAATEQSVIRVASIAQVAKVTVMENDSVGSRFRVGCPFPAQGVRQEWPPATGR
jgi:hypothetical protein